jgi:GDP-4-dehydro-6-deoxy-D-mannose reductase
LLDTATSLRLETLVDEQRLRPAEPAVVYGSHRRLTEATGWAPQLPLEGAVAALLDDWRERVAR